LSTSQTSSGSKCAVCQKNKFRLHNRRSKLNGQPMFVCTTCFEAKLEPRWLVIIIAQEEGQDAVKDYIINHKYFGPEIPASDLYK
jgi:hypothetical protein